MQKYKNIGKLVLDYTYYQGKDFYTDGSIEDEMLEMVKKGDWKDVLYAGSKWPILYHLSDMRENLLEWYPFSEDSRVLEIGSGCGALTGLLSRKTKAVTCIELSEKRSLINAYRNQECDNVRIIIGNFQDIEIKDTYDYITLIGVWEYAGAYVSGKDPYLEMIEKVKRYLRKDGKIIIAIENKTGLKYWNGAPEDHTGNFYSGLNDYTDNRRVRTFSRQEIERILNKAGISKYNFYYPMPDYKLPETIYSDVILPLPGSERNYGKDYGMCRIYNFYDDTVFDQVCSDGMFPYFANSFLLITGEEQTQQCYEKYNRIRKEEYRIKTEISEKCGEKYVRKTALNKMAAKHVSDLKKNEEKWKGYFPNIRGTKGSWKDEEYFSPYIDGTDLDVIFYGYRNDLNLFIERYCYYAENFLKPLASDLVPFSASDEFITVFGKSYPFNRKSLKYTNVDLIFSNLKLTSDGQLYCFDYEWVFDFLIPYEYVIWRSASQLYKKYMIYLKNRISKSDFFSEIGLLKENCVIYERMENNFHTYVYGNEDYLKNYRKSSLMQQLRFSQGEM